MKTSRILQSMPPVESEQHAARRQLERILVSSGFARNERMSRFLRFVVERHLEGRDHELKESVIAKHRKMNAVFPPWPIREFRDRK